MPEMIGMNPAAANALAKQLDNSAASMEQTMNHLLNRLRDTGWAGDDRRAFDSRMNNSHRAAMQRTVGVLRQAAADVRRHANDQLRASGR